MGGQADAPAHHIHRIKGEDRMRIISRLAWLAILIVIVGCPLVFPTFSWNVVTSTLEMGARRLHPPPILPGPIKVKPGAHPITAVMITGDDGKKSWLKYLFPIIQKYRLPCTHFVLPYLVGEYEYMTWDDIKAIKSGAATSDLIHLPIAISK